MNGGPKRYEVALAYALEMEARAVPIWNRPKWFLPLLEEMNGAEERGLEKPEKAQASADKQDGEYITIPIKHRESQ